MKGEAPPTTPPGGVPTVAWREPEGAGRPGVLELLDQTRLPHEATVLRCATVEAVREAIQRLAVRGAPALGVAGAYGLVLGAQAAAGLPPAEFEAALGAAAERLRSARPTAVNLGWALDRCLAALAGDESAAESVVRLLGEARRIHAEDEEACRAMGRHALSLLRPGGAYLTHCNTGRLATAGIGTAFAAFVTAAAEGWAPLVYACEVRPLLQGSRLTAFELAERGIEGRLLPDGAAGALLRSGRVEAVLVGADRIARNGDTANKVGTYALAELARANGVPFYVVAPTSTVDLALDDGSLIPIEERSPLEVLDFAGSPVAPRSFPVMNPAFDVTPAHLVTRIVTERGIAAPPYEESLPRLAAALST